MSAFFDGQQPAIANDSQNTTRMSFFLGNLLPSCGPLIWTVAALAAQFAIQQLYWPLITLNSVQSRNSGKAWILQMPKRPEMICTQESTVFMLAFYLLPFPVR